MEMIEKVARALCADTMARWREPLFVNREAWKQFIPAATAAIEAMREPTDEMISNGTDAIYSNVFASDDGDVVVNEYAARTCFEDMIDTALGKNVASPAIDLSSYPPDVIEKMKDIWNAAESIAALPDVSGGDKTFISHEKWRELNKP